MKTKTIIHTMASAAAVTPDVVLAKIKDAGQIIIQSVAGLSDILEDPLKSKFLEVKNTINTMLSGLPESDKVPAALGANNVLECLLNTLVQAQSMINTIGETAKYTAKNSVMTRASMTEEVNREVTAKITAGELIPKDEVAKRITDATNLAATSTREAIVAERKVVDTRRTVLTTAGIPVPTKDEALIGKDEEFAAKQATAKTRAEELKPFGLAAERVLTLCWDSDQKSYEDTMTFLKGIASDLSKKNGGINPFQKRDETPAGRPSTKLGVC